MKPSIIKTPDELPMFLTVMDMASLLGISRSSAYELAAEEGFPKLRIVTGRIIIPKDKLLEWLDSQTNFDKK
jgi:excisionase family DNA binding protein